ncbi:MAG: hypothetical protein SW019_18195, partial [Actinomycetota bacterium]|nr:hypothetical protein [Actinomycetota bacterium]
MAETIGGNDPYGGDGTMTFSEARDRRRRRYTVIYAAATSVAFASGTFALLAMLIGSPRTFGFALALSGAGWIVTHFIEHVAERDRAAHRRRAESPPVRGSVPVGSPRRPHRRPAPSRRT